MNVSRRFDDGPDAVVGVDIHKFFLKKFNVTMDQYTSLPIDASKGSSASSLASICLTLSYLL